MIRSFRNQGTEDVFHGVDSKPARRVCPPDVLRVVLRKLTMLDAADDLRDLRGVGNSLEKLDAPRAGQHAIRVNDKYRVCFLWTPAGPEQVEVTDYH